MKVAIQGIKGCNHYVAAKKYFAGKDIETIDCDTFKELAGLVAGDPEILGIMAIENTIAGSLLQNYRIIREAGLKVVGEYKLRIKHALVALPGVKLEDIVEVNSHPMALMQCGDYLEKLPGIKLVEKDDTAGAAKWISENGLRDHAAICPADAAELFGMNVLADGIETNKRNFTRFLIVTHPDVAQKIMAEQCPGGDVEGHVNKSELVFTLPHTPGSLSKILTVLSFYDMNLTMIQSLPIIGKEWEYQFYSSLMFDNYTRYRQAINAILPLTKEFRILGEYMEGQKSIENKL